MSRLSETWNPYLLKAVAGESIAEVEFKPGRLDLETQRESPQWKSHGQGGHTAMEWRKCRQGQTCSTLPKACLERLNISTWLWSQSHIHLLTSYPGEAQKQNKTKSFTLTRRILPRLPLWQVYVFYRILFSDGPDSAWQSISWQLPHLQWQKG